VFTVSNTNDSGDGSLRKAIQDSNAAGATAVTQNTIQFDIVATGVQTIALQSPLPVVSVPTVIDGTTQPGAQAGTPLIQIDGTAAGAAADGIVLSGGNSAVRGLIISNFTGNGVHLETAGTDTVSGNYIGVDPTAATIAANGGDGVLVDNVGQNVIGGTLSTDHNVISGNKGFGVDIKGGSAGTNLVEGNFIGTDLSGTKGLPNTGGGVQIENAPNNTVGGSVANARNVISGNSQLGIFISGLAATRNFVEQNFIGTDITGSKAVPNVAGGVEISGAPNNTVGGTITGEGNTISGNTGFGVEITGTGASGNILSGNNIGTNSSATLALGNTGDGVDILSPTNTVGGATTGSGNVIGGNIGSGIQIEDSATGTIVQGNFIGTNSAAIVNLGNGVDGVVINGASNNVIGANASATGFITGVGNVLAFSGRNGVTVLSGTGNSIRENRIFSNTKLGIDLAPLGPNPIHLPSVNTSSGANELANPPILSNSTSTTSLTTITGQILSTPSTSFEIDFYSNTVVATDGHGQGAVYIGTQSVTTDAKGLASYTFSPASPVALNSIIVATATDTSGNTSEFSTEVGNLAPSADLSVSITGPTTVVPVGGFFVYTITVTNNGPSTATTTVLTDTLPANVTSNLNEASQGTISQSGNIVTAQLGTLNSGATATVTLSLTPTAAGTLTNTASASSAINDPKQANNSATIVTTAQEGADLQIVASTAPTVGIQGSNLAFIYTITNNGPATATSVGVGGALPTGATLVSVTSSQGTTAHTGGTFTSVLGSLVDGASATVTVLVTPESAGSITSSAGVTSALPDPFTSNNFVSETTTVISSSIIPTTDGPEVTSVVRSGTGNAPTHVAVTFNSPVFPQVATLTQNYNLVTRGRDGSFGSAGSTTFAVKSVTYDAATNTVTIITKKRIPLNQRVQLTVIGTAPLGVRGTNFLLLDGTRSGKPGSNFVTVFKGTKPVTF
jgi:uncharacterized repeat protein (TIGR01451 family)